MKYKIIIKRNLCQSAATCVAVAPDIYKLDDEFKADIKNSRHIYHTVKNDDWTYEVEADDKKLKEIIAGAKACPYKAIEIYNEKGKRIH